MRVGVIEEEACGHEDTSSARDERMGCLAFIASCKNYTVMPRPRSTKSSLFNPPRWWEASARVELLGNMATVHSHVDPRAMSKEAA